MKAALITLFVIFPALAHAATVRGRVLDARTRAPLAAASIGLQGAQRASELQRGSVQVALVYTYRPL